MQADSASESIRFGQPAESPQGRFIMPPVNNPGQRRCALVAAISLPLAASGPHAATFSVTSSDDAGPGTLRQAIVDANSQTGPHVIEMSAISGDTITLASDLPAIKIKRYDSVELVGSQVRLSGDDQHQCLSFNTSKYRDGALQVDALTITGCNGALVGIYADLLVSNSIISENKAASDDGGGISLTGDLTVENTVISSNAASGRGGGIFVAGSASISDSYISNNSSLDAGGGLFAGGGLSIVNSVVSDNDGSAGGGIHAAGGSLDISTTVISGNVADDGGGLYSKKQAYVDIADTSVDGNSASGNGGGVFAVHDGLRASADIQRTVISDNYPQTTGGLELSGFLQVQLANSEISGNAAENIGGINLFVRDKEFSHLVGSGLVDVSGTTISNNNAVHHAGAGKVSVAAYYEEIEAAIRNVTVSGNSAGGGIGGLQVSMYGSGDESIVIDGVTITGNDGGNIGGLDVYSYQGGSDGFEIRNSIIAGNTSSGGEDDLGMSYGSVDIDVNYTLLGTAPSAPEFILDAVSQALAGEDPVLGPLADNGGPTPTHLPGDSGAGVNFIPPGLSGCGADLQLDQRGEPRPGSGSRGGGVGSVALQHDP